jgi:penicillin amidase
MKSREVHTRESFIEAQLDTVDPTSRQLLPLIGAICGSPARPPPRARPTGCASARWICWPSGTAR